MISSKESFTQWLQEQRHQSKLVWFSFSANGVFLKGWAAIEKADSELFRLSTISQNGMVMWSVFKPIKFECFGPEAPMTESLLWGLYKGGAWWRVTSSAAPAAILLGEGEPEAEIHESVYGGKQVN